MGIYPLRAHVAHYAGLALDAALSHDLAAYWRIIPRVHDGLRCVAIYEADYTPLPNL